MATEGFIPTIPEQKFSTPEEELVFLRKELAKREQFGANNNPESTPQDHTLVSPVFKPYAPEAVTKGPMLIQPTEREAIVLKLSPERHDRQMYELLNLLKERGVLNTLAIVEKLKSPHLEDDFHRFLMEYLRTGNLPSPISERAPLFKSLKLRLYEVSLNVQALSDQKDQRSSKEILAAMEQFYAGMLAIASKDDHRNFYTLEIAVQNQGRQVTFYAAIPEEKTELFEKQILSIFPNAKIKLHPDDYNIFNESGFTAGSYATYKKNGAFSLKTHEQFEYDPLNVILNSLSKIEEGDEGAAFQIIIRPAGDYLTKKVKHALEEVLKGMPVDDATNISSDFGTAFKNAARFLIGNEPKKNESKKPDEGVVENLKRKAATPVISINIRAITSAATEERASQLLSDMEASFNQFEDTYGNRLQWKRLKGKDLSELVRDFSFRNFSGGQELPASLRELATLFHFPGTNLKSVSQLKQSRSKTAPAATDLPKEGILLGVNRDQNFEQNIYMGKEDRVRHFYVIGQTGTGKTSILKNMIVQDIKNGDGVCMIDPHGSDIEEILAQIPESRYEDVVYFDPGHTARPVGLNMLEYDQAYPEQRTFVVDEMLSIFNKLFNMQVAGGPAFEQYFRNSVLLTIDHPESGNTLLDVSRVLADKNYRAMKIALCRNPIIVQFWREIAEKTSGEQGLQNMVPYITNKFDVFLSNDIMRPIVAQQKSSFNFRQIMDEKKILLVNLSKGKLGEINSSLLGLIIVGKILMAAFSRVDMLGAGKMNDFYLYIDEFQNVTTDSIATILSEARKYRLSLNIAHQYVSQLTDKIKNAVFGNVGSMAIFRVGPDDAPYLEKQVAPVFSASDIMGLDNFNSYVKMLAKGQPTRPFSMETVPPVKGDPNVAARIKEMSHQRYGRARAEVEKEIMDKYLGA